MEKAEKTSENQIEQNPPQKKTCIWAKISFFSALSAWIIFILLLPVEDIIQELPRIYQTLILCSVLFSLFLTIIAFVSAIVGSIRMIIKRNILKGWRYIFGSFLFSILFWGGVMNEGGSVGKGANLIICGTNMSSLSKAILLYNQDYGRYPTPDMWCDLLLQNDNVSERYFICRDALRRGDEGRCHYAINPNCSRHSPPDTVLLFETKGGWNQHGGPELLTTEHHKRNGRNVINIAFNDGHVELVEAENLNKLKWDNKPKKE
jgi:prepilin-type processing-associated H-X9-DG protein